MITCYKPTFIKGKTVEELKAELNQMIYDEWAFGLSIDTVRLWDIEYTIKRLQEDKKNEA